MIFEMLERADFCPFPFLFACLSFLSLLALSALDHS